MQGKVVRARNRMGGGGAVSIESIVHGRSVYMCTTRCLWLSDRGSLCAVLSAVCTVSRGRDVLERLTTTGGGSPPPWTPLIPPPPPQPYPPPPPPLPLFEANFSSVPLAQEDLAINNFPAHSVPGSGGP